MEGFIIAVIAFIIGGIVLGGIMRKSEPQVIYVQVPSDEQRRGSGVGTALLFIIGAGIVLRALGIV